MHLDATDPQELLSAVPHLMRAYPDAGVVALASRGDDIVGISHSPLKRLRHPTFLHGLTRSVLDRRADRLPLVALYLDLDVESARASSYPWATATRLSGLARLTGVGVEGLWVVGTDGFYEHGCTDQACCPPGGRDLDALRHTALATRMIAHGSAPLADMAEAVPAAVIDPDRVADYNTGLRAASSDPGGLGQRVERTATALLDDAFTDEQAGQVVWTLLDPTGCGAVLHALLLGGRDLAATARALAEDDDLAQAVATRLANSATAALPAPDQEVFARVRTNLRRVASLADPDQRAAILLLLAHLAWWVQDSMVAHRLLAAFDPASPVVRAGQHHLHHMVTRGVNPPWMGRSAA